MIFHDPYAMHRPYWHEWLWGEPWKPDHTSRDWVEWDFILADVYQVIMDLTDPETGQLMIYDQSSEVYFDVKLRYSGAQEALENYRKNHPELPAGASPYVVPVFRDPDNKPTLEDWIKNLEEDKADRRPEEHRDARPPTPEELRKIREEWAARNTKTE